MQLKTPVLILAGILYVTSLAAEATLLGVGSVSSAVGLPLLSSTVTLGLGAGLALIEPGGHPTAPQAPVTAPAAPATPAAAPGAPTARQGAAQTPAEITGQAAAPAMPTGG